MYDLKEFHSKLTDEQVRMIKYGHPGIRQIDLAKLYNTTQTTISFIKSGKCWGHI